MTAIIGTWKMRHAGARPGYALFAGGRFPPSAPGCDETQPAGEP